MEPQDVDFTISGGSFFDKKIEKSLILLCE